MSEQVLNELLLLSRRFLDIHNQKYQRQILPHFGKARLSILIGPRGVGKTTFLIQYLLKKVENNVLDGGILYVPCDHFLIGTTSLYEIAQLFYQNGGQYLVLDEIHKYSNWSLELKSIFDTFPKLMIIASGSSALQVRKGSHDLSRRAIIYYMPGLSFREYLELYHSLILPPVSLKDLLQNHQELALQCLKAMAHLDLKLFIEFKTYLKQGYYPYYLQFKDQALYYITVEQNVLYALEADLPTLYPDLTGHSIKKIKQLLSFIASAVPFKVNMAHLKNVVDISDERTVKNYLKYLEDMKLIRLCMKASKKMRKISSPEKIYLDNPNQLYALCPEPPQLGTVRELFFLSMVSSHHEIEIPAQGDFLVDGAMSFEVGGRKKSFEQLAGLQNAYLACDELEEGIGQKIPLWLFGFLY